MKVKVGLALAAVLVAAGVTAWIALQPSAAAPVLR